MPIKKISRTLRTKLTRVRRKKGEIHHTPEMKRFFSKHKKDVLRAYKILIKNFKEIKRGEIIKEGNIEISNTVTGSYKGGMMTYPFRVKIGNQVFFVKLSNPSFRSNKPIEAFAKANFWLEKQDYQVNGFRVIPVKPHLFYEREKTPQQILVTDFFGASEVEQIREIDTPRNKLEETALDIEEKLSLIGVHDSKSVNMFFDKKNNTIYLYDFSLKPGY